MSTSQIRAVAAADLPALKHVIDGSGLFPSSMLDGMIDGYLKGNVDDQYWLTLSDGSPIAIAHYVPEKMTRGTWNLLLIAVDPSRQHLGHGAALIRHIERALSRLGARILIVETSGLPEFERARAFYKKLGYDLEARVRNFYEAGNDKIIFRKALDTQ